MEYSMNDTIGLRRAVDRILLGDVEPILKLLAEDVDFCVAVGGDEPICLEESGKQPVVDYFTALGELVTFWQMDYTARGDQLIAWGKESFTIENCALEGGCEFALVFDVSEEGVITRFLVVEDLPSFIRDGGSLASSGIGRPSRSFPSLSWLRSSPHSGYVSVGSSERHPPSTLPSPEDEISGLLPAPRVPRRMPAALLRPGSRPTMLTS
jgi:hypothetical protein